MDNYEGTCEGKQSIKKDVNGTQRQTSLILLFFKWPNPLALARESGSGIEIFSRGHFTV